MTRPPNVVKRTLQGTAAQPVPITGPVPMAAPQPHLPVVPAASAPVKLDPFVLNPVRSRRLYGVRTSMLSRSRIERELDWAIARLQWLAAIPGNKPVVADENLKGKGSKTLLALYLGAADAEYTRHTTLVLPATANTVTADAAARAGVLHLPGASVKEIAVDAERFQPYQALSDNVARTPSGLLVVKEDSRRRSTDLPDLPKLDTTKWQKVAETLRPNVDVLIQDGGNDDIEEGSIPEDAAKRATAMLFTATAETVGTSGTQGTESMSLYRMQQTVDAFLGLPEKREEAPRATPTGHHITIQQKVQNSVVAVSMVMPGDTVDFESLMEQPFTAAGFTGERGWRGIGIQVPFDKYMLPATSVCDINAISPLTRRAVVLTDVACYEMTARNLGIPLGDYDVPADQRKNPLFSTSALAPQAAASTTGPAHRELVPAV